MKKTESKTGEDLAVFPHFLPQADLSGDIWEVDELMATPAAATFDHSVKGRYGMHTPIKIIVPA